MPPILRNVGGVAMMLSLLTILLVAAIVSDVMPDHLHGIAALFVLPAIALITTGAGVLAAVRRHGRFGLLGIVVGLGALLFYYFTVIRTPI